jgi:regulatory LacI family protein
VATTVKDVAQMAGVSIATVSRVINETATVSSATRQRVLSAVSTLQFCPNENASALSRTRSIRKRRNASANHADPKGRALGSSNQDLKRSNKKVGYSNELLEENTRLKHLVTKISRDLEKWMRLFEFVGSNRRKTR